MAEPAAFTSVLNRIGFNVPTRQFLVSQGMTTIEDLRALPEDEVSKLIKHASAWRPPTAPAPQGGAIPAQVIFPYLSVVKLKALRAWADYREARGQTTSPAPFSGETISVWLGRLQEISKVLKDKDADEAVKPAPLASFSGWEAFEEAFITYLSCFRSAGTQAPINYCIREESEAEVTAEIRDANYDSIDDDLIATIPFTGATYRRDNKRVYDKLKPLVVNGPGWSFIQVMNRTKNG